MAGITKVVKFSEGVATTQPLTTFLSTTSYASYANDAAFVTAKGSAAADGDSYYNTTLDLVRVYANGSWTSLVDESTAQTISGVKTYSSVITSSNTTQSTDKDTGAIVTEGGVGIEKNLYVGGNAVITGDLTVNGTTTTINTSELSVEDSNVTVNAGGNTATADANDAGLRVDLSDGTDCQLMFDSTATSKFKIGQVGSESEVATLGLSQVFTNKTFDDAKIEKHISTPSNPSAGYVKTYVKNDNKIYTLTSAGTEKAIGGTSAWTTALAYSVDDTVMHTDQEIYRCITGHTSGTFLTDQASGYWVRLSEVDPKNINLNPVAESGTTNYTTYADAAGTIPVDMTGGSPNITWTRNTTLPLGGVSDFLFTKDAANRQGEGVALAATMPKSLFAKNIEVSFDYTVASGTYVDGDLIVYCYDVTNATLLEPVNISIASVATALPNKHIATFQTSLTGTSYRIGFHVASTSASAYTLQFRNIYIGEQVSSYGPIVTDWKIFTPTGSWNTNTTYAGYYRRIGDTLEVQTKISLAGAPNAAALTINLPSGLTIDTAKLASNSGPSTDSFGKIYYFDSGVSSYIGELTYSSTTSVGARYLDDSGTNIAVPADISTTAPHTWGASDFLVARYSVPIIGWSSNVVLSSAGDGRLVVARAYLGTNQTGINTNASAVKINIDTTSFDGTASFGSNKFTAPATGTYNISGRINLLSTNVLANTYAAAIYKNGSVYSYGAAPFGDVGFGLSMYVSDNVPLNKGDYVELYIYGSGNNSASTLTAVSGSSGTYFNVEKINPGSQRLAASESVSARAYLNSNQTGINPNNSYVKMNFDATSFDSHGAYSTSNFKYTCPVSGKYQVNLHVFLSSTNILNDNYSCAIYKNGSIVSFGSESLPPANKAISVVDMDIINCNQGDYLEFYMWSASNHSSSTLTASAGSTFNYVSISKVGN